MKLDISKINPGRWKLTGGIWGIVGVAALAVVLALAVMMIPRAEVAARVNGERITAEDVAELRARYDRYGMSISFDEALEYLITEKLLYQEARNKGHALSTRDAEFELHTQLAAMNMTRQDLDLQLQFHGISYQEYLEGFRTGLAIQNYLEDTIEVTEEEARARYDELAELYGESLPLFEIVEQQIIAELQQEAMPSLIDELRGKASIEYGQPAL
ncbi:MAG: hypothetical protein ACNA7X_02770 [Dehalococcoidia bacterium]